MGLPFKTKATLGIRCALFAACFLISASVTSGYIVGPAHNLETLAAESDLIIKATAIHETPVNEDWFAPESECEVRETSFKIVSVIKGTVKEQEVLFRHYDRAQNARPSFNLPPLSYHFETGRTYIVFSKKTDQPGVYRQLWLKQNAKKDQGVLRCADDWAVQTEKLKDLIWAEMLKLLKSSPANDVIYGINQLNQMAQDRNNSFSTIYATNDFERTKALAAIAPLMKSNDASIATAAITVIASSNPYFQSQTAQYWLATVGSGEAPGIGKMDAYRKNLGGELHKMDLMEIASSARPDAVRALAIRALGLVRDESLRKEVDRWLSDPAPSVRASAAVLLADYPRTDFAKKIAPLIADKAPEVRASAAYAIGFTQQAELAETLEGMLRDVDANVRRAASLSLLSFSPDHPTVAQAMRANIDNNEFNPLFLNALAKDHTETYLERLAKVVEQKSEPKNWPGGQIPSLTSFNILFKHLQGVPQAALQQGKFNRYLDAMEKGYRTGSSEPRDIYAFYLQRGMTDRAKKFREIAKKEVSYDLDYYFNMVDVDPSQYSR